MYFNPIPKTKVTDFQISNKNKQLFRKFKSRQEVAHAIHLENSFSYKFAMKYNKDPLESIKIFENIASKYQNDLLILPSKASFGIEPRQDFKIDHNLQILKYQKKHQRTHAMYRQKYGIRFDSPEFIRFACTSRRLRDRITIDHKQESIKGINARPLEKPSFVKNLGKRASMNIDRVQPEQILQEHSSNSSHPKSEKSFFGSSRSVTPSKKLMDTDFLMRSVDDRKVEPDLQMMVRFMSEGNNQMTHFSLSDEESPEETLGSNKISSMLRDIEKLDTDEVNDKEFRRAILNMMQGLSRDSSV